MEIARNIATPKVGGTGRWLGLASIMLTTVGIGLVLTTVIVALPTLAVKLNATTSDMQWIIGAFQLTFAALMIPAGFLGDRYGRKLGLIAGASLFGVASLVATQVTTATQLIWVVAVLGAASAIVVPLALSILPAAFPDDSQRKTAVGLWAAAQFLTLPLGPLVGGWLLNHYDWSSIFWINVPFAAAGLLGVAFFIPESRNPSARPLDILGTLLSVGGMFGLIYGVIRGPIDGWSDPKVLATLGGGVALLVAFVVWERRAKEPLVDLGLFAHPSFSWSVMAIAVAFAVLTGGLFMVSPYFQVVQGNDVMGTGVRLLPMVLAMMVAAGAAGKATKRAGIKTLMAGGLLVMGAGLLTLSLIGTTTGYGLIGTALGVIGFGVGLVLAPAFDALVASLSEEQKGIGSAVGNAIGKLSQAMSVAILGSILNSVYRANLTVPKGLPPAVLAAVQGSVVAAVKVAQRLGVHGQALATSAKSAYVTGMSEVMVICAVVAIASAIVIFVFLPSTEKAKAAAAKASEGQQMVTA